MNTFGAYLRAQEIEGAARSKALTVPQQPRGLVSLPSERGWMDITPAQPPGYFQLDLKVRPETVLSHPTVFACVTLISNDIGKLRTRLMALDDKGIWAEITSTAFSPVLRRPNSYQNQIQFKQLWIISKLLWGNAYILKVRDGRGVVIGMYILDPALVQPMIAPDGSIFYQLAQDNLSGLQLPTVFVPASEIIHDRMNCLFHPLVGVSPLFAATLPASSGLEILKDSQRFFRQGAKPSGILVSAGEISDGDAAELKTYWNDNFTGPNSGKVAVVGNGLKYEPIRMSAVDSQTKEQVSLVAEMVAQVFHVPAFKVGGPIPAGQKVGDLNQIYFNDALHSLIEELEACLDEGISLPSAYRTELELDNLLRMDPATQADVLQKLVGYKTINEGRHDLNLPPLPGGDTVYMQQQDFPLQEVRHNKIQPPAPPAPAPAPAGDPLAAASDDEDELPEEELRAMADYIAKELECEPT